MMYCGDQRLVERAKMCSSDLIAFCGTEWTNYVGQDGQSVRSHAANQAASDWEAWCHAESHRRTGYSVWVRFNISFLELFSLNIIIQASGLHVVLPIPGPSSFIFGRCQ